MVSPEHLKAPEEAEAAPEPTEAIGVDDDDDDARRRRLAALFHAAAEDWRRDGGDNGGWTVLL